MKVRQCQITARTFVYTYIVMERKKERCWIALGGLLHDIGKLIHRAGLGSEYKAQEDFGYAHAGYTYTFLEELFKQKQIEQGVTNTDGVGKRLRGRSLFLTVLPSHFSLTILIRIYPSE